MIGRMGRKWLLPVLALAALTAAAQDCPTRTIPVTFYSADAPLEPGASVGIKAEIGGKPAAILSSTQSSHRERVVILQDLGRYLPQSSTPVLERSTIGALLDAFPAGEPLGLLAFGKFGAVRLAIGTPRDDIRREVMKLRRANADALRERSDLAGKQPLFLWDAIESSLPMFGVPQVGDAIVVLSDGYDPKSRIPPAKVRDHLLRGGVRLFAAENLAAFSLTHSSKRQELIESFWKTVRATGGRVITDDRFAGQPSLDDIADAAVRGVIGFKEIRLQIPPNVKSTKLKMAAIDADGRPVGIHYAQRLPGCALIAEEKPGAPSQLR
jgi:hypothetical protein